MYFQPPYGASGAYPPKQGMYNPAHVKDACGLAMVATLRGEPGHDIIALALEALRNLEHRGAIGSDAGTGDGAGILTQMPDAFLRAVTDFELPPVGEYAAGLAFLPLESSARREQKAGIERIASEEGLEVLGWRVVPTANEHLGKLADEARPAFEQLFITAPGAVAGIALDRLAYRLRKRAGHELGAYFVSLSARTLGYKGMVTTLQLEPFYPDLQDERFASELAVVHSRYSTNTFPSWPLAQPLRMLAHNGEINTVGGNRNWMRARQSQLASELLGDIRPLLPICTPGASDSASFDEVLELLTLTGRSLPHAVMMMVPEAWEKQPDLDEDLRAFYEYHSNQMEPWDGPAALIFTDGTQVGATLDRNGLRPGRWTETTDGLVVIGSETGVLEFEPERHVADDGPPGEEVVLLEDEPAVEAGGAGGLAVDQQLTGGRVLQAVDGAQQGGLATAAGAEQGDELSGLDRQVDLGQCHQGVAAAGELLGEVARLDLGSGRDGVCGHVRTSSLRSARGRSGVPGRTSRGC